MQKLLSKSLFFKNKFSNTGRVRAITLNKTKSMKNGKNCKENKLRGLS